MSGQGYVYVMRNPLTPTVYKVGFTRNHPSERAEQLSKTTCMPLPFDLICFGLSENASRAERAIHSRLEYFRVSKNREFFRMDDISVLVAIVRKETDSFEQTEFCEQLVWEAKNGDCRMTRLAIESGLLDAEGL